jgi:hypothetical protein
MLIPVPDSRPRPRAGINPSRYIQAECELHKEGGGSKDWGGELGSHLEDEEES